MISDDEMQKIYNDAKQDKSLLSKINATELLAAYDNNNNKYLEDKTSADIAQEIAESFYLLEETYKITAAIKRDLAEKLTGYRFVDELDTLHVGKYTRWIQKYTAEPRPKISNGGILTAIEHGANGIFLKIRLNNQAIINIAFDNCLIYQKMSTGEQLVLLVADYLVT